MQASFCVNVTQARKEGILIKKMPLPDGPVGKSAGHFLFLTDD